MIRLFILFPLMITSSLEKWINLLITACIGALPILFVFALLVLYVCYHSDLTGFLKSTGFKKDWNYIFLESTCRHAWKLRKQGVANPRSIILAELEAYLADKPLKRKKCFVRVYERKLKAFSFLKDILADDRRFALFTSNDYLTYRLYRAALLEDEKLKESESFAEIGNVTEAKLMVSTSGAEEKGTNNDVPEISNLDCDEQFYSFLKKDVQKKLKMDEWNQFLSESFTSNIKRGNLIALIVFIVAEDTLFNKITQVEFVNYIEEWLKCTNQTAIIKVNESGLSKAKKTVIDAFTNRNNTERLKALKKDKKDFFLTFGEESEKYQQCCQEIEKLNAPQKDDTGTLDLVEDIVLKFRQKFPFVTFPDQSFLKKFN